MKGNVGCSALLAAPLSWSVLLKTCLQLGSKVNPFYSQRRQFKHVYGKSGMFQVSLEDVGEGSGLVSSWSHTSRFPGKQAVGRLLHAAVCELRSTAGPVCLKNGFLSLEYFPQPCSGSAEHTSNPFSLSNLIKSKDCCHSGTDEDLKHRFHESVLQEARQEAAQCSLNAGEN